MHDLSYVEFAVYSSQMPGTVVSVTLPYLRQLAKSRDGGKAAGRVKELRDERRLRCGEEAEASTIQSTCKYASDKGGEPDHMSLVE